MTSLEIKEKGCSVAKGELSVSQRVVRADIPAKTRKRWFDPQTALQALDKSDTVILIANGYPIFRRLGKQKPRFVGKLSLIFPGQRDGIALIKLGMIERRKKAAAVCPNAMRWLLKTALPSGVFVGLTR